MKRNKWTYLLGAALLALVSCIREEAPKERAPQSVEGKKVKVEFSIAGAAADPWGMVLRPCPLATTPP